MRERLDEVAGIRCPCGLHDLVVGGIGTTIANIVPHIAGEHGGHLRDDGDLAAQAVKVQRTNVDSVHADLPLLRVIEAQQQFKQGGLACARRPYKSHAGPRFHLEIQPIDGRRVGARGVVETQTAHADIAAEILAEGNGVRRRDDVTFCVQQFHQALGGPCRALQIPDDLTDGAHCRGHNHGIDDKRRQFSRRESAVDHVLPS